MAGFERLVFGLKTVQDISHTQSHTGCLVAIGGADTFTGGAYLVLAFGGLIGTVEHTMGGQYKMGAPADMQTFGKGITGLFELAGLNHKKVGGNHTAVADDIDLALIEYSGGNGPEYKFFSVKNDGMSGIGTAGKAGHYIVTRCKEIHHLTLAFVTEDNAQQGINFSFRHEFL